MTVKRRYKVLGTIAAVLLVAFLALVLTLGHNSACPSRYTGPVGERQMSAVIYQCYGGPDVLQLQRTAKPTPTEGRVLVSVYAAGVNPLDWHFLRGEPTVMRLSSGIGRPTDERLGVDFAGIVEAVGKDVTQVQVGDRVFGGAGGAFGEFVSAHVTSLARIPGNVSFAQAAAVPVAAVTALQALRDKGELQPGQKVLINGASGGVGTYAVQIAKAMGADVTGVCSTRNVELVRSLGADHVIDYTREDFTKGSQRYDLIIDNVGNHSLLDTRKALVPRGIAVTVGASSDGRLLGPLTKMLAAQILSPFVDQQFRPILADINAADLTTLADLMAAGKLRAVIDRTYELAQTAAAIRYVESGRARGKVVIQLQPSEAALPTAAQP
ncbi:MAG: NAD(P)-dependent alcohol dehydrogenase [Pseudomonadales bacterium]|nr:NAD(P)-dependent alcohol dehydrogenase [Pseudomonadales bacterium]